ncbi:amino acid adenylation domain protein [Rhodococcus sp. MTM3W5.2]|nr:amino acid adenylation domain protein [Rhodococcus sp. MTM3W5.2]
MSVDAIELRSDTERSEMERWNETDVVVPAVTLVDAFEAQVERTPDATALLFGEQELTYREFDREANRLARHLVSIGVGPETLVGLGMYRSVDLMVAMYAILKAGGGYLPIDPEHPDERTEYVVATANPVVVLSRSQDAGDLPASVDVMEIDRLDLSGFADTALTDVDRLRPLRPANVAYAMFTSGSTGRPKGVTVTHGSVVNQIAWMQGQYPLGPSDTVLQKAPVTFDVSVWELFMPLQVGARTVIAKPGGHRDPEYLVAVAEERSVTIMEFVPSMLDVFLADPQLQLPASLRYVLAGGEELPAELARRFAARSIAVLDNTYGPTEVTVTSTAYRIGPDVGAVVPIGRGVWNTRAHVLDSRLRPVPVGVPGELYLAGAQLARGYHDRADLTAERFVADPCGGPGERLYRTGDLVRWNSGGELEFLGRTDFQVKLRGLRIELGEIEAALVADPTVRAAVVVVHSGTSGQQLIGYVVGEGEIDTAALRQGVSTALPSYMIPETIMVLDEFPLSANGKLERRALPVPEIAAREYRAPVSATEQAVAAVFAELLGVERVGLDDNFFELGGNSLIGMRVVGRLRTDLETVVQLPWLFSDATPEALARQIERGADDVIGHAFDMLFPIRAAGSKPPVFCVHPIIGLAWCYVGMAQYIDADRPIYGLQTPAAQGDGELPGSIEAVAELYLREIRRVQPSGPYRLLGWSLGGTISHAIAVQLQEQGETVELLAMLDSFTAETLPTAPNGTVTMAEVLSGMGMDGVGDQLVTDVTESQAVAMFSQLTGQSEEQAAEVVGRLLAAAQHNSGLTASYRPGVFEGDLLFFTAAEDDPTGRRAATGWQSHVSGDVRNHRIASTHWGMMSPAALSVVGPVLKEHTVGNRAR